MKNGYTNFEVIVWMEFDYSFVRERRASKLHYTESEMRIIHMIKEKTNSLNVDNISRTKAYAKFFEENQEIRWSFLASMVSRNAGWCMTDLEGYWFPRILNKQTRKNLFHTYERANWLIFSDAFPQLLLYQFSKQVKTPYFYLLPALSVSIFMEIEWELFWRKQDHNRLMTAQIINEQNLIQLPVIENSYYKQKVFQSYFFNLQDWLHFSSVIFPTLEGRLYGFSVHQFKKVDERIDLGKKLAALLFHDRYYEGFLAFSRRNEHTGTRYDYEKWMNPKKHRSTPFLRTTYPIIQHERGKLEDWFKGNVKERWFKPVTVKDVDVTDWYSNKQKQIQIGILIEELLTNKKG